MNEPSPNALKAAEEINNAALGFTEGFSKGTTPQLKIAAIISKYFPSDDVKEVQSEARWHHGGGYLCRGSIRVARMDFDTDPSDEFKTRVFDEICNGLNKKSSYAPIPSDDARRLDWLEKNRATVERNSGYNSSGFEWHNCSVNFHNGNTVRQAIDAAMKGQQ